MKSWNFSPNFLYLLQMVMLSLCENGECTPQTPQQADTPTSLGLTYHEKFLSQPQPAYASATSVSANWFFCQYFLK